MPPTRREFLSAAAAVALAAPLQSRLVAGSRPSAPTADSVIFLMLTGGPSQLDTWDPKPDAPSDVRSPFAAIPTKVPGVRVTELFPKLAGIADQVAFVRSVHHTDAPIHEVGFQWVNTGRLFRDGPEWPSVGSVVARTQGVRPILMSHDWQVRTGLDVSHGQGVGWLSAEVRPLPGVRHRWDVLDEIPLMLGAGLRFITINQFSTVFDSPSWDCHADYSGPLSCSLADYRETVAPSFDLAFTQLITDLDQRGLLERTLVVATGEFGRTPRFNCNGGRDHWPGVWTTIFAGGGVKGGQVIGSSDAIASEPKDRPVHASDIPATIFHALGIGADATIPGPTGSPVLAYTGRPIHELF